MSSFAPHYVYSFGFLRAEERSEGVRPTPCSQLEQQLRLDTGARVSFSLRAGSGDTHPVTSPVLSPHHRHQIPSCARHFRRPAQAARG